MLNVSVKCLFRHTLNVSVKCVASVILSDVCIVCSCVMFVVDAIGDHIVETLKTFE